MAGSNSHHRRCRICTGALRLARPGNDLTVAPEDFVPTAHRQGAHGVLYRCEECGTVQQPSLPQGSALHELYRQMSDHDYLAEEEGRRRTARRLLDVLATQLPSGRLLDVGSGHGLLLDEARARGYEAEGLELSEAAVRHARDAL